MNRRDFIKAMGTACAALAVPLAWKRPVGHPVRIYYDPRNVRITFNGIEIKGFGDADFIRVRR